MTVAIEIEKGATTIPSRDFLPQSGLDGDIGKCAIAVVMEQRILPVVSDEQIIVTIVVIIAYAATLSPAATKQSGFRRHIGKGSITVVLEKMARWFAVPGEALQPPAID